MPNKDNLIIQTNGEIILPTDSKPDVIIFDEEKRQKIIQILRQIPSFLDTAKKLSKGKTYQAYFSPDILKRINDGLVTLDKKDNGLFGALIREVKTGQVSNHVSLMEIKPDLLSSLNQLAMQQTMDDIITRLVDIDEKITDILQGQLNDRIADVKSGIKTYEQAIVISDPDLRQSLLVSAIQKLNDGCSKLIENTDLNFIDKLPRNSLEMFFSNNWNISKRVQLKAEPVWKAAHAIVKASRYLVLAYSALDERDASRVSLEQVENEVKFFQEKIEEIVRWLPPTNVWHESLTLISQGVLPNIHELNDIPQKTVVVEFQPREITHTEGVEL